MAEMSIGQATQALKALGKQFRGLAMIEDLVDAALEAEKATRASVDEMTRSLESLKKDRSVVEKAIEGLRNAQDKETAILASIRSDCDAKKAEGASHTKDLLARRSEMNTEIAAHQETIRGLVRETTQARADLETAKRDLAGFHKTLAEAASR